MEVKQLVSKLEKRVEQFEQLEIDLMVKTELLFKMVLAPLKDGKFFADPEIKEAIAEFDNDLDQMWLDVEVPTSRQEFANLFTNEEVKTINDWVSQIVMDLKAEVPHGYSNDLRAYALTAVYSRYYEAFQYFNADNNTFKNCDQLFPIDHFFGFELVKEAPKAENESKKRKI